MKRKLPPMALVIFAVCMVSYSGPMVKGALNAGATPASVAFLRMLAAGVLILPLDWHKGRQKHLALRFSQKEAGLTVLAALFLAGHYLTWITSLTGTSTFASVALVCTQPLFVSLLSWLLFHEKTPKRALPGAGLALLGALTIAVGGMAGAGAASGAENLQSSLLALAGAVLMAAHWLTCREIRRTLAAELYTPVLYLVTAAVLALTLPLSGGFVMPVGALPWMAGLVIGSTLLGHAVFAYALEGVSANVVSFALLGEPVGAMIFSIFLFGEIPTVIVAAGGLLTLLGLALYLARSGQKDTQKEENPMADASAALETARALLTNVTPLHKNCGRMCEAACCEPDETGENGMLLFPGEEAYYAKPIEGFPFRLIPDDTLFPGGKRLVCEGICLREHRPLACRLFPLRVTPEGEAELDPRAWAVCPLLERGGLDGMSPEFREAVTEAGKALLRNDALREAIETEQRLLDEMRQL